MNLAVNDYDQREQEAFISSPIRVIEAFQAAQFNQTGVPIKIRGEEELFKYSEMRSMNFEPIFSTQIEKMTVSEFDLVKRVTTLLCDFGESNFGKKSVARGDILSSLNGLRHIRYLFGSARPSWTFRRVQGTVWFKMQPMV